MPAPPVPGVVLELEVVVELELEVVVELPPGWVAAEAEPAKTSTASTGAK